MIKEFKIVEDTNCFFKKQKFNFDQINLFVGDQGSGKSSLLHLLYDALENENKDKSLVLESSDIKSTFFLDLEKDNPRHRQSDPYGSSDQMLYLINVKYQSHGEVLVPLIREINRISNSYIFLDEPESSLSLRSQYSFIEIIKSALERNNQIFMATHNIVFMEAFKDNLISLETLKKISLKKFKESQREPSNFKDIRDDKIIKKTHCSEGLTCKCAAETNFYNNKCENYIDKDGKRKGDKKKRNF